MPATMSAAPGETAPACLVDGHVDPPEMVDGERRQQVGGDEQAVEGTGADLGDEQQAAEHGDRARDPAERPPTRASSRRSPRVGQGNGRIASMATKTKTIGRNETTAASHGLTRSWFNARVHGDRRSPAARRRRG